MPSSSTAVLWAFSAPAYWLFQDSFNRLLASGDNRLGCFSGVVREAIHRATAEAEISSRDQTRGNCSSMGIHTANQLRQNTPRRV